MVCYRNTDVTPKCLKSLLSKLLRDLVEGSQVTWNPVSGNFVATPDHPSSKLIKYMPVPSVISVLIILITSCFVAGVTSMLRIHRGAQYSGM
jgi:hypothetical protein